MIAQECISVFYFMQGQKEFTPKMIYTVNIDQLVAKDNFYRILKRTLNLHWLYKSTEKYYGREGQESIDPVALSVEWTLNLTHKFVADDKSIS